MVVVVSCMIVYVFASYCILILFSLWVFCTSQEIGWEDRLWNDLECLEKNVKPNTTQLNSSIVYLLCSYVLCAIFVLLLRVVFVLVVFVVGSIRRRWSATVSCRRWHIGCDKLVFTRQSTHGVATRQCWVELAFLMCSRETSVVVCKTFISWNLWFVLYIYKAYTVTA